MRRLCLALACVLLITVAVRANGPGSTPAPAAQAATAQKPAPSPTPAQAKPAPIQPGYIGSKECLTCHDQEEKLRGTPHQIRLRGGAGWVIQELLVNREKRRVIDSHEDDMQDSAAA